MVILDTNRACLDLAPGTYVHESALGFTRDSVAVGDQIETGNDADTSAFYSFAVDGHVQPFNQIDYPTAYYYNGKTYIVWQGLSGDPYICTYTHATKTFSNAVKVGTNPLADNDSHGAPCVLVNSAGKILVMFGAHDSAIQYSISTNVEDITLWTAQASPGTGSYPKLIKDSSNNIWFFYRGTTASNHLEYVKESVDGGVNWGAAQTILNIEDGAGEDRVYVEGQHYDSVNGRIHLSWNHYNANLGTTWLRKNVYHAYLKLSDSHMYSMSGTDLGTGIDLTEMDASCLVRNSGSNDTYGSKVHLDSNGYPYIIFGEGLNYAWGHYFTRWNGSAWTSPETITTDVDYPDFGCEFVVNSDNTIDAYLGTSGVAGYGGNLEKWRWDSQEWFKTKTILSEATSGYALDYPMIPVNLVSPVEMVFCEMKVATTGLKVYSYNDNKTRYEVKSIRPHYVGKNLVYKEVDLTLLPFQNLQAEAYTTRVTDATLGDAKYRTKYYLDTYLPAGAAYLPHYVVAYGMPLYPLYRVFIDKQIDVVFSIGEPESKPLIRGDGYTYGYEETVPVTICAIDKENLTAVNTVYDAEREVRRCLETYPFGTFRRMDKKSDKTQRLGSTTLYSSVFDMKYTRGIT